MDTNTEVEHRVYRVEDVAELLMCDKSTVYRLIKNGRLKVVRLGTSFRITQKAINEFLDS